MHQNAPFQRRKYQKNFLGRGHSPLPRPHPRLEPPPNHISGYGSGAYAILGTLEDIALFSLANDACSR